MSKVFEENRFRVFIEIYKLLTNSWENSHQVFSMKWEAGPSSLPYPRTRPLDYPWDFVEHARVLAVKVCHQARDTAPSHFEGRKSKWYVYKECQFLLLATGT